MTPQQARRYNRGRDFTAVAATGYDHSGRLRHALIEPGDYVVVIENRKESGTADVRVAMSLDFEAARVRYPDRLRGVLAVVLSLAFFAGVAIFTGVRLRAALEQRDR
jgi:hypothetical protein